MATYSAVTAGEKDADSPVNVSLIDKLDQNPHAIAEGASGAPKIQAAAIDTGVINQGHLNTGQGEVSTASGIIDATLPGGEYVFYPNVRASASGVYSEYRIAEFASPDTVPTSYVANITFGKSTGGGGTAYANQRYINASPPHAIESVDYRDFIFLKLDNNGDVIAGWMATDPPWFHNGPTKTSPNMTNMRDIKRRRRKIIPPELKQLEDKKEFIKRFKELPTVEQGITTEFKNSDIAFLPQPFLRETENIVIIEPSQSGVYNDLCDLFCEGESVLELIHDGYLKVDNTEINTNGRPPGVPMHRIKWK